MNARQLEPQEFGAAADLLDKVFTGGRTAWLERFEHWWPKNPAWSEGVPRGWIVSDRDDLVGVMANIPIGYRAPDGSDVRYRAIGSLAVHPRARGQGMARLLAQAATAQDCDLVVGTQTSIGCWRTLLSVGFSALAERWPAEPVLIVGAPSAFARRVELGWPLRSAAEVTVRIMTTLQQALGRAAPGDLEVQISQGFAPADDDVLRELGPDDMVTAIRESRNLNWAYFDDAYLRRTRLVLVARRGGRLQGYAAFKLMADSMSLLECRVLSATDDAARALLVAARAFALENGHSHITVYPFSAPVRSALPGLLTVPAPKRSFFSHCIYADDPSIPARLETGPWDGDAAIMDDWAPVGG